VRLGDGELGVGLDGVAQGGVLLVALIVGLLQRRGLQAGAVLLKGRVLLLEGLAELLDGFAPELVVELDFLGALAHGGEVLVVRRVGRPRDGIDVNLHRDVQHNGFRPVFSTGAYLLPDSVLMV